MAMSEKEREAYRQEFIKQAIGLGAFLVTLVAYQAAVDSTFRIVWAARIRAAFGPKVKADPEPPRDWVRDIYDDTRGGPGGE
jgi:hypothetical protein